jgi:hypothetical protein
VSFEICSIIHSAAVDLQYMIFNANGVHQLQIKIKNDDQSTPRPILSFSTEIVTGDKILFHIEHSNHERCG